MNAALTVTLSFEGRDAENNLIDFYDVARALEGFQRSLALTSHLVINGEIITQAPALKGARIIAVPPEEGSWKFTAIVIAGIYSLTTAPKDTPLGHLIHSVYDYAVSESLGFHVDYDKSLGELYEVSRAKGVQVPRVKEHQLDSLIEKCSTALEEMHRPIFKTGTASTATIQSQVGNERRPVGGALDLQTFEYIHEEFVSNQSDDIEGRVSSYNSNTFKGRIYTTKEGRPVPFELSEQCRSNNVVQLIVASLSANAVKNYNNKWSTVHCRVFRITSRSGHLKKYMIFAVSHEPPSGEMR